LQNDSIIYETQTKTQASKQTYKYKKFNFGFLKNVIPKVQSR